jgi:hypothetical protein
MPPQIADRAIDARDEDAICLTEVIMVCRLQGYYSQPSVYHGQAR